MITGSRRSTHNSLSSVEIWSPDGITCNISDMTKSRYSHVQFTNGDAVTVCGGWEDKTCETLKNGQWRVTHTMHKVRSYSAVWTSKDWPYIMSGYRDKGEDKTSERPLKDGRVAFGLTLKYNAK